MSLLDELAGFESEDQDAYDQLPEPVKLMYSREQWVWLSDKEKRGLVVRECEPESFES
jgi:hypothetical protein